MAFTAFRAASTTCGGACSTGRVSKSPVWSPTELLPQLYLPVAPRHEVLAGVERLSVQHADAPVVVGGDVLLRDGQVALLQDGVQLSFSSRAVDAW